MKFKSLGIALAFVFALGGAALAETSAAKLGLGAHDPVPEKTGKIDRDLFIRVRLILEKTGALALNVKKGDTVSVQVDYLGRDGAADRPVALVCTAQFISSEAEKSAASVNGKPCLDGRLQDSYGRYTGLDMKLRFRAEQSDPPGTYGVLLDVKDSVSGKHIVLVPTYRWLDGKP